MKNVESPWHAGELAMQSRAGTRERMAQLGPRVIRAAMPEQHRELFEQLPFIVLGAADESGQPWATLLAGAPGFVAAPDATHLRIDALPAGDDPLAESIAPGAALGLLGIELQTRRRNRANGDVESVDARGFTLEVTESFGNCPKYIRRRELLGIAAAEPTPSRPAQAATLLDGRAAEIVRGADTFFVATRGTAQGADVSHRGGRPGFVDVGDHGRTLRWPDFTGNGFFNTFGNLALDARAGLVFADFASGDLVHVAGRAEVQWSGAELDGFAGAERLVRLDIERVLLRPGAFALRWQAADPSPFLDATGVW